MRYIYRISVTGEYDDIRYLKSGIEPVEEKIKKILESTDGCNGSDGKLAIVCSSLMGLCRCKKLGHKEAYGVFVWKRVEKNGIIIDIGQDVTGG